MRGLAERQGELRGQCWRAIHERKRTATAAMCVGSKGSENQRGQKWKRTSRVHGAILLECNFTLYTPGMRTWPTELGEYGAPQGPRCTWNTPHDISMFLRVLYTEL